MRIAKVLPKDDFVLSIVTDDGTEGLFDVKPYLKSEAFFPLNKKSEFLRVGNGRYFVEWKCGADLSADTIFARWKVLRQRVILPVKR